MHGASSVLKSGLNRGAVMMGIGFGGYAVIHFCRAIRGYQGFGVPRLGFGSLGVQG